VDGLRGASSSGACRVLHMFLRTVREQGSDSPFSSDGLRVRGGRSIFLGALLDIREAISDGPPPTRKQFARTPQIVRPLHANGVSVPHRLLKSFSFLSCASTLV
jgi:hypothetical protein